jgi:hypothetical protein
MKITHEKPVGFKRTISFSSSDTSEPAAVVKFQPGKFELAGGGAQKTVERRAKIYHFSVNRRL